MPTTAELRKRVSLRIATLTQYPHKERAGELDRLAEELIRLERPATGGKRSPYLSEKGQRYSVMSARRMREQTARELSLDCRSVQVSLHQEETGAKATRRSRFIRSASKGF